jgi:hypothetical protein
MNEITESLIPLLRVDDPEGQRTIRENVAELRHELLSDETPPLRKLVVEQLLCAWVDTFDTQEKLAFVAGNQVGGQAEPCLQDRLDHAHQRLLSTVEVLAGLPSKD